MGAPSTSQSADSINDFVQSSTVIQIFRKTPRHILWLTTLSALLLLSCSSLRHILFQSGFFDIGFVDQVVYLISQGAPPFVSNMNFLTNGTFHFLGDHAAWIMYFLAPLYKLYPSIYWLFAIQAICLAGSALVLWHLGQQAGLNPTQATTLTGAYLLYPLVFNINLFDFHTDVIALPLLFLAVLAARNHRPIWFSTCLVLILGCKAVLSLTIAAMGLWLLFWERKRGYGLIALILGSSWFMIATQTIIPYFSGTEALAVGRYAYLGDSVLEIVANLLLQPGLVLHRVFSVATLEYLALLTGPVLWGISLPNLAPLISTVPAVMMNLLSDNAAQRNVVHHYSLPILPFLMLVLIGSLATQKTWLRQPRWILLWSMVMFLALGKYGYFGSVYLSRLDTWSAMNQAIAQVTTAEPVLTTHEISTHLTHRANIRFTHAGLPFDDLTEFKYVLLNRRHPGYESSVEFTDSLLTRLRQNPRFQPTFAQDDVYLFVRETS